MSYFKYKDKNIYYNELGTKDKILVLLHGNTASSKMFDDVLNYYINDYKVLLIDFLGCGKSQRIDKLNIDLWYDEAMQVIELLDEKGYKKVNIIGTSGGALCAINIGLERPDLVNKIIADSFEGEESLDIITSNIIEERKKSKQNENASMFYYCMNGKDWENVVDNDTNAIYEHSKKIKKYFHKSLSTLETPILFTGSKEDEFVKLMEENYYDNLFNKLIKKVKKGNKYLFEKGFHPAMISNASEYAQISKEFFDK